VAALPHEVGYDVRIIDQRTDRDWKRKLSDALTSDPLCVGITSMTGPQIRYAIGVSETVKSESEIPVVFGGVHPTLLPEQTIESENVDVVVVGEGDITFFELIKALEEERPLEEVRGLRYKEGEKVKRTPLRPLIEDMDKLPRPPWELIDLKNYYGFDTEDNEPSITLPTSRGCPNRCAFCYNQTVNRGRWRGLSAEKTLERIRYVVDSLGIKKIYFQDDNFCSHLKRFHAILQGLIEEDLDISWGTSGVRADSVIKMKLEKAERSGCRFLEIGAESGSERILRLIKKDLSVLQILAANRKLSSFPFHTKYSFVCGFPTETEEEVKKSISLALKLGEENPKAYATFYLFTPYPGVPLFDLAVESGFKPPDDLEGWADYSFSDWYFKYPSWLSHERIKMLDALSFTSRFANRNIRYKIKSRPMKFLFELYHPIARFRFKHTFYHLSLEKRIGRLISQALL
jgi:radical SAM superfamily enzyme YgiQ (UPF0313 family)